MCLIQSLLKFIKKKKVDVDHVDHEQFPSFKDAHYVECILREGEVLYIPVSLFLKKKEGVYSSCL